MKQFFKVYTIEEVEVITRITLDSSGLTQEEKLIEVRTLEDEFETKLEALERVSQLVEGGHEVEISETYR